MDRYLSALLIVGFALIATARAACTKLMLFGGENHTVYLGCLNCSSWDSESISNKYGSYGGKYSAESIWNKYGTYGSTLSNYSPWNKFASDPPIIVDDCGKYYGALTVNEHNRERATLPAVLGILTNNPHTGSISGSSGSAHDYAKAPTNPAQYDNMVAPSDGEVVLEGVLEGIAAGLKAGQQVKQEQARKQQEDEAIIRELDRRVAESRARKQKEAEGMRLPVATDASNPFLVASRIQTSILGVFHGWHVGSEWDLANGWTVKVISVEVEGVDRMERPDVVLTDASSRGANQYIMSVSGYEQSAFVKRIK